MKKSALVLLVVSMSLVACNSGGNHENEVHDHDHTNGHDHEHTQIQEVAAVPSVYDASNTRVGFGAFKTTAKKEVKGWFTDFKLTGITEASDVKDVFKDAMISINVNSLDTKNEGRNATLLAEFFNKTTSNEVITGKVISFDSTGTSAVLELTFNDVAKELVFSYDLNGDTLSMQSILNLEDVNGLDALASISTACDALHKGDDGVSKTWSEVNIYLTTVLNR
jgi:polyisoprenoid-binding protein YceI